MKLLSGLLYCVTLFLRLAVGVFLLLQLPLYIPALAATIGYIITF